MDNTFLQGYMHKEAGFFSSTAGTLLAIVGLSLVGPAALGLGIGYTTGRGGSHVSRGVLKKQLEQQELQELENDLLFSQKFDKYKKNKTTGDNKEIHV